MMRYGVALVMMACVAFSTGFGPAHAEAASATQIPFTVRNYVDASHGRFHVQGGIPFPRAVVQPDAPMAVLDAAGDPVEAEIKVTGYWPDGSVKWVLVGMQPAVEALNTVFYTLCVTEKAGPVGTPFAQQDDERIHVDTGRIRFAINRTSANLFESLSLLREGNAVPVLKGPAGSNLFVDVERRKEGQGARVLFDANADSQHFSAELEEATPLRAVIRIEGTHASSEGMTFAPYTLRIYAYKNSGMLRLAHTFIYDGEPREDFLRAIGVRLKVEPATITGYTFGGGKGAGVHTKYVVDESLPAWRRGMLVQDGATHYRIAKVINPDTNSRLRVEDGVQSQGWGALETDAGQVVAGIKNFWQEYPKAIEVDCVDRTLTAFFYAPHSDALDLRRYSDLGYHALYEAGAGRPGTPATPFNHDKYNARYISKTTEMFLDFGSADGATPAATALLFQRPPLLRPAMDWIASTKVFGGYAAAVKSPHAKASKHVAECLDFLMNEQASRGWYSFIDYGDVMHSFDATRDSWRFDEGGFAWMNNEGQIGGASWMAYLHTGDERVYRFAEAMTRHIQDVDMYQMGPLAGCGMRHNVNHWGCVDRERRMTVPFNKRAYYFLSGDEHTRDRIHFVYEKVKRGRGTFPAMDFGVAATALQFLWETTGDAKYGEVLRKATETYCSNPPGGYSFPALLTIDFGTGEGAVSDDAQMLPGYFLMSFGPMRILMDSYELTGSEEVKNAVLNWAQLLLMPAEEAVKHQANFDTAASGPITNMQVADFAYRHTGDVRYLEIIKKGLDNPSLNFKAVGGARPLEPAPHQTVQTGHRAFQTNSIAVLTFNYPFGMGALLSEGGGE
jgi:exo-rhamnogalacturonan lyase-like protein